MENDNEKKGIFKNPVKIKKVKKSSCCCNFEVEEIPEDETEENKELNTEQKNIQ